MSEWWSYSPADFLMFSPRTYWRLFELYNASLWPAHLAALASGLAVLALLWTGRLRPAAVVVAGCWLWVAWAFLLTRYASINSAAGYFAAMFAVEALLLLVVGGFRRNAAGLGLVAFALLVQPWIGLAFGRAFAQAQVFGLAPDPTAVATLGLVLQAKRRRWLAMALPLAWCAVSGATLWAMGTPDAFVPPVAAVVAVLAALTPARH